MTDQFLHSPDVIGQIRFHRGCNTKCLMDAAQAKPRHEDMNSEFKVVQLAAVCVRPANESPKVNSQTKVCSLDMTGRYVTRIGIAATDAWDRSRNSASGTKPIRACYVRAAIKLNDLAKINLTPERFLDSINIGSESIGRELKAPLHALTQIVHECVCAGRIAPSDVIRKNYLRGGRVVS
jgi:hypothetical protein